MKRSATFARGLFSPLLYQLSYPAKPLQIKGFIALKLS
jgi:hypothetical protein